MAATPPRSRGISFRDHRAFGHDGGGARDRIGEIEVVDGLTNGALSGVPARPASFSIAAGSAGSICVDALQMRMRREQRAAQLRQRVVRQPLAEHVGQRAQDRPILARVAGRKRGARRHLHAALGVDVDRRTSPGRPRPAGSRRRDARRGRRGCRYRRRRRPVRPRSRRRRAGTARRAPPARPSAPRSARPRPARSRDRARRRARPRCAARRSRSSRP